LLIAEIVIAVAGTAAHLGGFRLHHRNDRMICQPAALNAVIVDLVAEPKLPHAREYTAGADGGRLQKGRFR
jgi:hypothetical protein